MPCKLWFGITLVAAPVPRAPFTARRMAKNSMEPNVFWETQISCFQFYIFISWRHRRGIFDTINTLFNAVADGFITFSLLVKTAAHNIAHMPCPSPFINILVFFFFCRSKQMTNTFRNFNFIPESVCLTCETMMFDISLIAHSAEPEWAHIYPVHETRQRSETE